MNGKPAGSKSDPWSAPQALPSGLRPVDEFRVEFLPDSIAPWVDDIANRLQCPPDYVPVSAMTALGAVVGRRIEARGNSLPAGVDYDRGRARGAMPSPCRVEKRSADEVIE
jgi:hypothetical protein